MSGGEELFKETMERFQRLLARNQNKALDRFGWSLFHSLPEDVKTRLREELGLEVPANATNIYNKGVLAASSEDWPGAIKAFETALEMDPTMLSALINLALATEKNGNGAKGRELFARFLEQAAGNESLAEDIAKVRSHLEEIDAGE